MGTKILWTDETWNPIVGCSKVSPGCQNCYAEKTARSPRLQQFKQYWSVIDLTKDSGHWNGKTELVEAALSKPLHWRKPRKIFVCSMGDLFHESVPFEWIDKVMAIIRQCPQHTFQVLTKRAERMLEYFSPDNPRYSASKVASLLPDGFPGTFDADMYWPIENLWLGVTAENQEMADKRIPILLQTPAAKRFVSVEPMLGAINFGDITCGECFCPECQRYYDEPYEFQSPCCASEYELAEDGVSEKCTECGDIFNSDQLVYVCPVCGNDGGGRYIGPHLSECISSGDKQYGAVVKELDWVIVGAESGADRRKCEWDWPDNIVRQCKQANVPCFVKQIHHIDSLELIKEPAGWPRNFPE